MDDTDQGVILVIGADTVCKTRVVEALAQALGASEQRKTTAVADGVLVFKKNSLPVVVDTIPFSKFYLGQQIFQEAKRWISQNALRRMYGKEVCVVCVVSGADAAAAEEYVSEDPDPDFFSHIYSWLDFAGRFIFPEHEKSIVFVAVNRDDNFDDYEAKVERFRMRDFIVRHTLSENITYADLRDRDSFPKIVKSAVKNIFRLENSQELTCCTDQASFQFRDLPLNERTIGLLGPWVPERVILVGRSGSGKSTLAQMLTLGRLDPDSEFTASSSIRGKTTKTHHGEGRGWYVVDTPGFGEAKGGSITSEGAEKKVRRYVQLIGGIYTHYIYVVKKDRIDKLDEALWKFFVSLFGDSIKDHFTIIVTNANKKWLAENVDYLRRCFQDCDSFLTADFPDIVEGDEEYERECQEIREESLEELEHGLTSLRRFDAWCDLGEWSKMTVLDGVANAIFDLRAMTNAYQKAVNAMRIVEYRAATALHRLCLLSTPEEGRFLLPEFD